MLPDHPVSSPRFHAFWAINGPLERGRLHRQLDQFHAAGFDGVVFHPRFYPGKPPYLSDQFFAQVSDAIIHAKSLGLTFWIYDEDGWPSGTVGGQLLKEFPEFLQRWVGLFAQRPESPLGEFDHNGARWYLAERTGVGVDYLNPALCQQFIRMTYERYRDGLSPEAFEHVEAFFCDEPEFGLGHLYDSLPPDGAIPWTPLLPQLYRERFGDDLLPLLPALFAPIAGHEEVRIRFWEFVNDLFCDAFVGPLNAWCREHGKQFTAHMKGEEHPLFQVPMVGSCHQVFQHLSLPGIDALERFPSNNFFPRQVSSAARQFGSGRCMAEAFGGAGWGATPADLERYLLWLGHHGLTDFVLHLSQYRLDSAAIRDWPPSQPLHLTWSRLYAEVIDRVRAELRAHPRPAAGTLVVAPYRGITASYAPWELMQTNIHDAGTYPATTSGTINIRFLSLIERLHRAGAQYDVTDERSLEGSAQMPGRGLQLGASVYERILVADGCLLTKETASLLQTFCITEEEILIADRSVQAVQAGSEDWIAERTFPVRWTLEKTPLNDWLLDCVAEADGWFTAAFVRRASCRSLGDLSFVFADDIVQAQLNGVELQIQATEDGTVAGVPTSLIGETNALRFRADAALSRPFVWLQGRFRVVSDAPFTDGPSGTVKTNGPFVLDTSDGTITRDLVGSGFPFLRHSVSAVAQVSLPEAASSLRLDGATADAIRLVVDERDLGWSWRGDGEYRFACNVSAGDHTIRIEVIPNTYNVFGPHHYYGGDWFVVSPDQAKGVRNFADLADAPEHTHVEAWHFRRLELPVTITALKSSCR